MFLYAFICFYTLLHALIGRTVRRTTRSEADSLSNRLLPAEAGKNVDTPHLPESPFVARGTTDTQLWRE